MRLLLVWLAFLVLPSLAALAFFIRPDQCEPPEDPVSLDDQQWEAHQAGKQSKLKRSQEW